MRSAYARSPTIPGEVHDPRRLFSPRLDPLGILCCRYRNNFQKETDRSNEDTLSRNLSPRCSLVEGWTTPEPSFWRTWCSSAGRPCSSSPSASPGSRPGSYFGTLTDRFAASCAVDPVISRISLSETVEMDRERPRKMYFVGISSFHKLRALSAREKDPVFAQFSHLYVPGKQERSKVMLYLSRPENILHMWDFAFRQLTFREAYRRAERFCIFVTNT